MTLADLLNEQAVAAVKLAPREGPCLPRCEGSHRYRWGTDECVTCLAPYTIGSGLRRVALYLKQAPGEVPFVQMWVSSEAGFTTVELDGADLAELGRLARAAAARIGATS